MNDEESMADQQSTNSSESFPAIATGLGAVAGGVTGGVIGKSVAGTWGAVVGGVTGAIAGGIAADAMTDFAKEANESLGLGLGADTQPIELPQHYSWEELQALSKPQ